MKFTEFCKQNGIVLLRDDMRYIRSMICNIPDELRKRVLSDYARIWLDELTQHGSASQGANLARRKANIALPGLVRDFNS